MENGIPWANFSSCPHRKQLLRFSSKFCLFLLDSDLFYLANIPGILFLELIFHAFFVILFLVFFFFFCFVNFLLLFFCLLFVFASHALSVSMHSCARQCSIQAFSIFICVCV